VDPYDRGVSLAAPSSVPRIGLPPEQFAAAFPFHVAVDADLALLQVGSTLRRVCPDVRPGARLDQVFRAVQPEGRITFEWILENKSRFFLLEHRGSPLQLRGQFVALPGADTLLFLGSPWFADAADIAAYGLGFEDFAIHDPAVDLLQLFQASKMALADAKKLAAKLTAQRAELRAVNERLRSQEADARKLALIAARTDNAVVLTDPAGLVVWVNEGFTRQTGYTLEEVQGRTPGSVLQGPGTDAATVRRIGERLRRGEGFTEEILNYGKDGREYWLAIEMQPIRDDDGRIVNFMAIESDITARREAERVLKEEADFLEQARRRELETGHAIQRALLIGEPPAAVRGVAIAGYTEASQGIDGDFYAFTTFRPDCVELLVGDVMGKGVPAALIGAAVRTAYNQVVTELLAASLGRGDLPRPAAIMNALHVQLTPRLIELDTFVTAALYRFDLAAGTMSYVNAGHTAGIVVRAGGGLADVLGENLPVGVVAEELYVERSEPIGTGDALLVYSDGVTEARNPEGMQFGEDRLRAFVAQTCALDLPPNIWLQVLRRTVRSFVGSDEMLDDQSAVLVGIRSLAARDGGGPDADDARQLLDLPWQAARLEPLRRQVAAAAGFLGADAANGLVLAAFEAATNVVRHVAPPFAEASLSCRILREAARVVVEIWYLGDAFRPGAEPQPDFSGDSDGGFGLYIMSRAVTSVAHESPLPGVCCTRLVQALPAPVSG